MGGMGDEMGDEMSEDMDMNELPDGVQKEIIREAPAGTFKTPKAGDEVTVHYVGTLHSDGTEFDSSRSRDKAFTFTLGKGRGCGFHEERRTGQVHPGARVCLWL